MKKLSGIALFSRVIFFGFVIGVPQIVRAATASAGGEKSRSVQTQATQRNAEMLRAQVNRSSPPTRVFAASWAQTNDDPHNALHDDWKTINKLMRNGLNTGTFGFSPTVNEAFA